MPRAAYSKGRKCGVTKVWRSKKGRQPNYDQASTEFVEVPTTNGGIFHSSIRCSACRLKYQQGVMPALGNKDRAHA